MWPFIFQEQSANVTSMPLGFIQGTWGKVRG